MSRIDSIIITKGFPPIEGGIETYMFQLANRWNSGNVCVLCDKDDSKRKLEFDFKVNRISNEDCSYMKAVWTILPKLLFKSKKKIIALRYFVLLIMTRTVLKSMTSRLHVFFNEMISSNENTVIQCATHIYSGSIGLLGKLLFNNKLIVYIHGTELLKYQERWNFNLIQKFILNNADLIISNSHYTKSIAVNLGVSETKIKVINLGADTEKFYPTDSKEKIYKKYNINKKDMLLLSISHLIPRKGNDMVIQALPKIIQKIPNVKYMIGGAGRNKEKLLTLADELNLNPYIIFAGYIRDDELNDYQNACDVFIMPNRKEGYDVEGFGIVFLEANACKKAVIAGASGGAVDAVVDEKTGYLVNPLSVEDIAEKAIKLLSDDKLREEIADAGYRRVVTKLNWKNVVEDIERSIVKLYD
ncbi:MAG: glycosyltransferase family 4 protein [Candidatus Tenebribacter davisii]|nr:glycosyltransferase family 4 protein [Candidatus Tenebribacter davisii]